MLSMDLNFRQQKAVRRYGVALWILALLFFLRVVGQALVAFFNVAFLPPMAAWYSGIVPYHLLLPIQLVILAVQINIGVDFWRAKGLFVVPKRRMGQWLRWFSYSYAVSMILRYLITRSRIIPIVFHCVLATYLFLLGHFHTGQDVRYCNMPRGTVGDQQ